MKKQAEQPLRQGSDQPKSDYSPLAPWLAGKRSDEIGCWLPSGMSI